MLLFMKERKTRFRKKVFTVWGSPRPLFTSFSSKQQNNLCDVIIKKCMNIIIIKLHVINVSIVYSNYTGLSHFVIDSFTLYSSMVDQDYTSK